MGRLDGRVAIVTGASQGIGKGVALRFAREGATTVITSRTLAKLQAVADEAAQLGLPGRLIPHAADLGDRAGVFALPKVAVDHGGRLDIIVCNGQGFGSPANPSQGPTWRAFEDLDEDEWEYMLRTGVTSTMWLMKASFPWLSDSGHGRIITFGSGNGVLGAAGTAPYNASKEAIRAITRTAAREWGKYKITANTVNPAVSSEGSEAYMAQNPDFRAKVMDTLALGELGTAEDVGGACAFLASDDAAFITGMTIRVDSGKNMYA
jgi:NAD(P)-dependent dehydrogenase (short-subunit alcohol dehydrogenase family)